MDTIILAACAVIVLLMIVGVYVIVKDQTAPIGAPPKKDKPPVVNDPHES